MCNHKCTDCNDKNRQHYIEDLNLNIPSIQEERDKLRKRIESLLPANTMYCDFIVFSIGYRLGLEEGKHIQSLYDKSAVQQQKEEQP